MPLDRIAEPALLQAGLWTASLRAGEAGLLAQTPAGAIPARAAPGCLVAPLPGDLALMHGAGDQAVIVAILGRPPGQETTIAPADGQRLTLRADAIAIEATSRITATAPEGVLALGRASLRATTLSLVTGTATLAAGLLRSVAQRIEQSAEQLVAMAGNRTTVVRGDDVLRAGNAITQVESLDVSRSGSTIMTARQDLRVDAERIALG